MSLETWLVFASAALVATASAPALAVRPDRHLLRSPRAELHRDDLLAGAQTGPDGAVGGLAGGAVAGAHRSLPVPPGEPRGWAGVPRPEGGGFTHRRKAARRGRRGSASKEEAEDASRGALGKDLGRLARGGAAPHNPGGSL